MRFASACVLLGLCSLNGVRCLDNGLALTPPMGWLSWERYRCQIDCDDQPDECISERLYMRMADKLVSDGFRDAGYVQVNIDDCWSLKERDPITKRIVADPKRFPSGIPALVKYMHDRGLKLGIYGDAGAFTCAGYPGSEGFVEVDAQTFAEWGVDSLKFDGCNIAENDIGKVYQDMSAALLKTNKPILYSCEWPLYLHWLTPNYTAISDACNIFRNFNDVQDEWTSIMLIMEFYAQNQDDFAPFSKPGSFFDPDMLVIGDYGLSPDEERAQMALWTIWAAPLFMSNDLYKLTDVQKKLLLNKDIIKVNQDPMGRMGKRIKTIGGPSGVQIFRREVQPCYNISGTETCSLAIALVNLTPGAPMVVQVSSEDLQMTAPRGYLQKDLFGDEKNYRYARLGKYFNFTVNPSGALFYKFEPVV